LESLTLKLLTLKVTALIALAAAPRAQTLVAMNVNYMQVKDKQVVFLFPLLLKTTKNSRQSFSLILEHFCDESLCVMHTLLFYLSVTKSLRKSDQVLISYVTYNAVTTSTVARWLKIVLNLAGIDTSVFKAHSFRSASASAASAMGCSIRNIMCTADWKSDKTFNKFYHRYIVSNDSMNFASAVFARSKCV
jgi:hypothetical protein